jgi:predicted nuclease with TOPRIM domain
VTEGARTKRATILAVVEGAADLERVKEVLRRRYAADYEISCTSSLARAERELREKRAAGEQVAVVLVEQSRPKTDLLTGVDLVNERSVVGGWPLSRAP